jgi:hypothetical protein
MPTPVQTTVMIIILFIIFPLYCAKYVRILPISGAYSHVSQEYPLQKTRETDFVATYMAEGVFQWVQVQ